MTGQSKPGQRKSIRCRQSQILTIIQRKLQYIVLWCVPPRMSLLLRTLQASVSLGHVITCVVLMSSGSSQLPPGGDEQL